MSKKDYAMSRAMKRVERRKFRREYRGQLSQWAIDKLDEIEELENRPLRNNFRVK